MSDDTQPPEPNTSKWGLLAILMFVLAIGLLSAFAVLGSRT